MRNHVIGGCALNHGLEKDCAQKCGTSMRSGCARFVTPPNKSFFSSNYEITALKNSANSYNSNGINACGSVACMRRYGTCRVSVYTNGGTPDQQILELQDVCYIIGKVFSQQVQHHWNHGNQISGSGLKSRYWCPWSLDPWTLDLPHSLAHLPLDFYDIWAGFGVIWR